MKKPDRVLIVHPGPQFSVHDVFAGWQEGFSDLGIRCIDYNLQDRIAFYDAAYLYTGKHDEKDGKPQFQKAIKIKGDVIRIAANGVLSTAYQFWPDLIVIVSAFFVPLDIIDILRSRGHKVVLLFTESPYEESRQVDQARHADLVLLNDPARISMYDERGLPAIWYPHAYRPRLHYPGPGEDDLETDFAFIGTGYPSRIEFFNKMLAAGAFEGLDVTLGGHWQLETGDPLIEYLSHDMDECVENELATRVYRSAKVGLSLYRREVGHGITDPEEVRLAREIGGYACNPREIEMAACGLFFIREPHPESDKIFGDILPTFASPEDAAEMIQYWVHHPEEREERARAARAAIRGRTFTANVQKLLEHLDAT